MRTAIYARVSTQEQAKEGYSISTQRDRLTAFAHSQDWEIHDYYVDEGQSAKDTQRPEIQRMMNDVKENKLDVVLVYKLDRLTRSVTDLYKLLETFDAHGVAFRSATEVYDTTTAMGRMFITIVAALAQWERENLGERVKINMLQLIKEGRWHGGRSALGFTVNKEEKILEIEEAEADVVRLIFSTYLSGKGGHTIAAMLNEMGYKTSRGNGWKQKAVDDILKNPLYYGEKVYGGESFEAYTKGIVSKETFDAAQVARDQRRINHPRRNVPTYIFSGILRCARCGTLLNGKTNYSTCKTITYYFYTCPNNKLKSCDLPMINQSIVEEKFIELLEIHYNELTSFDVTQHKQEKKESNDVLTRVDKQLTAIKIRKKKWQLAFANDAISLDELKELTAADTILQNVLLQQQKDIRTKWNDEIKSPEEMAVILSDFIRNWDLLTLEEKKQYARIVIKEFSIDTHNERVNQYRKRKAFVTDVEYK